MKIIFSTDSSCCHENHKSHLKLDKSLFWGSVGVIIALEHRFRSPTVPCFWNSLDLSLFYYFLHSYLYLGEGKIRKRTGYTVPQVKLELISLRRGITPIAKWLATGREVGEEQSAFACSKLAFGLAVDVSSRWTSWLQCLGEHMHALLLSDADLLIKGLAQIITT